MTHLERSISMRMLFVRVYEQFVHVLMYVYRCARLFLAKSKTRTDYAVPIGVGL